MYIYKKQIKSLRTSVSPIYIQYPTFDILSDRPSDAWNAFSSGASFDITACVATEAVSCARISLRHRSVFYSRKQSGSWLPTVLYTVHFKASCTKLYTI